MRYADGSGPIRGVIDVDWPQHGSPDPRVGSVGGPPPRDLVPVGAMNGESSGSAGAHRAAPAADANVIDAEVVDAQTFGDGDGPRVWRPGHGYEIAATPEPPALEGPRVIGLDEEH
jgi:hypothetical protein